MKFSPRFVLVALTAITTIVPTCVAQDAKESGQATPAVSGTGNANHIAVWKNSTTLGSSGIVSSGGNVGIGTSAPAAKLEVSGDVQVDGNFSLSGSILLTGFGQLIWQGGAGNFSAGTMALPSTTTGSENTAVGEAALEGNTSGIENTAMGFAALAGNATGSANTAIGYRAIWSGFSGAGGGVSNTAVGWNSMFDNTSGNSNTAVGANALFSNSTGSSNAAFGEGALLNSSGTSFNTALGADAMSSGGGNYNIAIGFEAGSNASFDGNIHIGSVGVSGTRSTIRIGCATVNNDCALGSSPQSSAYIAGVSGVNISGVPVLVSSSGQLGIASSSARHKEEIQDMAGASDGLMRLRPVTFRYKKAYEDGSKPVQYGLVAEEVAEIYPDLVAHSSDGQIESVRYQLLGPMLLNELQKQHATIDAQREQIRSQDEHIRSLEDRLARIEAALAGGAAGASAAR